MLISILCLIPLIVALAYRFGRPYLIKQRTKNVGEWPETQATIQSAKMELVERVGHLREELPFFTFSYIVDSEYYSGRFGLRVPEERANSLIRDWIDTRVGVRYDPNRPSIYCLPDELSVDGFRVSTVRECELASEH